MNVTLTDERNNFCLVDVKQREMLISSQKLSVEIVN